MDDKGGPDRAAGSRCPPCVVQRPQDVEAYRRLAAAVSEWNAYCAPTTETLASDDSELLDKLADVAPP